MLPVRKVVLFKHGVGYFERTGGVEDSTSIDLHFQASEMNDVLKSLTVLDLSGGVISSIGYESTEPLAKQLERTAFRLPERDALTALLAQAKGARIEVEVGSQTVVGVLTGTETVTRRERETSVTSTHVALLVDGATLRSFDLLEVKGLRFLDESLQEDLQYLLDISIAAKKRDSKKLTIFAQGEGPREVLASYVVETPVWKTSYRVLWNGDTPHVQGWALVDNHSDEDWEDVALTLVAGLPISFVHDLYSPRYKRRPVVEVVEEQAYAPPILEAAAGEMDDLDALCLSDAVEVGAMPVPAAAPMGGAPPRMASGRPMEVQTRTAEVGDLLHYEISNPVTVRRHESALVPILSEDFDGERVSVYNEEVREKNPLLTIRFKNTTGLTLEGGPLTVLEEHNYVGESMLDTLKPGEERLVPYSVDLGCVVLIDHRSDLRDVHRVMVANGIMRASRHRIQRRIYAAENRTDEPKTVLIEHRFQPGWKLVETPEPSERTEKFLRFQIEIPARGTRELTVSERGLETEKFALLELSADAVNAWLESHRIDRSTEGILRGIASLRADAASMERRIADLELSRKEIFDNQARFRENLDSLGDSQEEKTLRERYLGELTAEEDRLGDLKEEIRRARERREQLRNELRDNVMALELDTSVPT